MQLIIDIPEEIYQEAIESGYSHLYDEAVANAVAEGTPLPKGHGRLIDENEILKFLRCPKYENCCWRNCFDCNKSRCINFNNFNQLASIIEEDKESEDI